MRMRFKPYAHDELMAADFHVHEPLIWGWTLFPTILKAAASLPCSLPM